MSVHCPDLIGTGYGQSPQQLGRDQALASTCSGDDSGPWFPAVSAAWRPEGDRPDTLPAVTAPAASCYLQLVQLQFSNPTPARSSPGAAYTLPRLIPSRPAWRLTLSLWSRPIIALRSAPALSSALSWRKVSWPIFAGSAVMSTAAAFPCFNPLSKRLVTAARSLATAWSGSGRTAAPVRRSSSRPWWQPALPWLCKQGYGSGEIFSSWSRSRQSCRIASRPEAKPAKAGVPRWGYRLYGSTGPAKP